MDPSVMSFLRFQADEEDLEDYKPQIRNKRVVVVPGLATPHPHPRHACIRRALSKRSSRVTPHRPLLEVTNSTGFFAKPSTHWSALVYYGGGSEGGSASSAGFVHYDSMRPSNQNAAVAMANKIGAGLLSAKAPEVCRHDSSLPTAAPHALI